MPNQDNYHIRFVADDGTEVGLILCDSDGRVDERALNAEEMGRLAIKMAQGGTKHSDFEPPYSPLEQRDMSGGRGARYLENDRTKFADSMNIDSTIGGHVFLGPRPRYSLGPRTGTQWVPGGIEWLSLHGDTRALDIPFTPDASYTAREVWLWLKYTGSPEDLQIEIFDDSGGDPSSQQSKQTVSTDDNVDTVFGWPVVIRMGSDASVSADTKYHIVVNGSVEDDSSNHWQIGYDPRAAREVQYTDTGGWTSTSWGVYYRVMEDANEGKPHFFHYKGAWYMGYTYDDGVDIFSASDPSEVYINGEQGIVSGGNKNVIEDDTKSWATDEHKGSILIIVRGSVSSTDPRWAKIESNNGTTLVLESSLATDFDVNTEDLVYVIIGSDRWTEITGHGMRGAITDVLSTHSIAYFAMGDDEKMIRMRRFIGGAGQDTWTTEWEDEDLRATFLQIAPDSDGVHKIFAANHEVPSKVWRASPVRGTGSETVNNLGFDRTNLVAESSFESISSWTEIGDATLTKDTGTVFGGAASGKVVTVNADEGIYQDITTETDERYIAVCVVQADTIPENGEIQLYADSTLIRQTPNSYQVASGEWAYFKGVFVAGSGTVRMKVVATAGGSTFYVDEVEVWVMPTPVDMNGEERITNLVTYGEPKRLWVMTDGGIYLENQGYFRKIPLDEYESVRDDRNGRQALVHDTYLYTTLLDGLEQYYRSNLEDMGPNRGEGLPENRRGEISFLAGYPPRMYAGIDAGDDGYSSIQCYNGLGWHELYRAPYGQRIRGGKVQAIPGDEPDRLWFGQGSDILWIPLALNPVARLE